MLLPAMEQRQQDNSKQGCFHDSILSKPNATRQVNDCRSTFAPGYTRLQGIIVLRKSRALRNLEALLTQTRRRHGIGNIRIQQHASWAC